MFQDMPMKPPYEQVEFCSLNAITLASYEAGIQEYILGTASTLSGDFKRWVDEVLTFIPLNAQIFEIGSGAGRDADYMESLGFQVQRTDAVEGFVAYLQEKGHSAKRFNVLTDEFLAQYDLIFANGVFLHLTPLELSKALKKIKIALKDRGLLAFSVKKGEGGEFSTDKLGLPRYFSYWEESSLMPVLEQAGFEVIRVSEAGQFLQIIAKPHQN